MFTLELIRESGQKDIFTTINKQPVKFDSEEQATITAQNLMYSMTMQNDKIVKFEVKNVT